MNFPTKQSGKPGSYAGKISPLVIGMICISLTGCEEMLGAAFEQMGDANPVVSDDPQMSETAKKLFAAAGEACPQQINEYTTLIGVKQIGINRFRYDYVVSESGRTLVNLNKRMSVKKQMVRETLKTPMAAAIVALDLGVDHVYKDTDGIQMLSYAINRSDLGAIHLGNQQSSAGIDPEDEGKLAEKYTGASKSVDNPSGVQSNPHFD